MIDISQHTIQIIYRYALPIALALLAFAIIIYLNRKKIKLGWLNLKTRYYLNQLGIKQVSNLQCPDGLGHYFTIDRLILRHDGITLLVFKRYPGKIFCADQIHDWTQMLGNKSYRFENPLYDLNNQIKAVSSCVPNVPVNGFLFFDHLAEFPKGHPDSVFHLKNIPEELKSSKKNEVAPAVMSAWKSLLHMAKS